MLFNVVSNQHKSSLYGRIISKVKIAREKGMEPGERSRGGGDDQKTDKGFLYSDSFVCVDNYSLFWK